MKRKAIMLALAAALAILVWSQAAWAAVTITQVGPQTVNENNLLTFTVTATTDQQDKRGNYYNLNFNLGNGPTGSTLTPESQQGNQRSATFNWTPNYTQAGSYQNVIITASEVGQRTGSAQTTQTTFTITVGNTNRPPVLDSITTPLSINEAETLSFGITGSDPDGDAITFSAENLPTGATFSGQSFSWTPGYNQAGTYDVLFKVTDNGITGGSLDPKTASQWVTITVGNVNRPPTFTAPGGAQTANAGELLTFQVTATDDDTDDTLTFSAGNLPTGAEFDATNQTFSWTPGYDQAGNYTVTFAVSDGHASVTQDVSITVNANRPPVLGPLGDQQAWEGKTLTFVVDGSDPDGGELTFSTGTLPSGADFNATTRTFTWTPDWGQVGEYTVTFTVTDSGTPPLSNSKTIKITVGHTNRTPILQAIGPKQGSEGQLLEFTLNGSDPDGDDIIYSSEGLPAGATLTGNKFSWTPDYSQAGNYQVTFFVTDNGSPNLVAQETVTITIGNVNRPPSFDQLGPMSGKEGTTLSFTVNATDPDGDGLTYSCSNLPAGATFDPTTHTFTWPINYGQAGNYTVTFCATDNCPDGSLSDYTSAFISVAQPSPSELINSIVAYVLSLKLDKNVENSYIANLKKVDGFIIKGQLTPAINQLKATIQKVDQDLKKGGLIEPEPAAQLKLRINELLNMLTK